MCEACYGAFNSFPPLLDLPVDRVNVYLQVYCHHFPNPCTMFVKLLGLTRSEPVVSTLRYFELKFESVPWSGWIACIDLQLVTVPLFFVNHRSYLTCFPVCTVTNNSYHWNVLAMIVKAGFRAELQDMHRQLTERGCNSEKIIDLNKTIMDD